MLYYCHHYTEVSTINSLLNFDKPEFSTFSGIYMSGFFITEPRLLSTMCLLFDKIHLPNNLEYVISFSKKYRFEKPYREEVNIESLSHDASHPFINLTAEQQVTANTYLKKVLDFSITHHELFGEILLSDFFPNNQIIDTKLVKKGSAGELNTYKCSINPMRVSLNDTGEGKVYTTKLEQGAIPIFGKHHVQQHLQANKYSSKFLASLLAMNSINLVLPPIKSARPETILETRYNLRDYLPLFWSTMLRFSKQFRDSLNSEVSISELMYESTDFIDTHIRPILIEIDLKMRMERQERFKHILSPNVKDSMCLSMGQPMGTRTDIINTSLELGTGASFRDLSIPSSSKEVSGLTFLLNLATVLSTKK